MALKVVIITQEEPFFLPESLRFLFHITNSLELHFTVIVLPPSPFGKRESMFSKVRKTIDTFGLQFFFRYAFQYLFNRKSIIDVFKRFNIDYKKISGDINSDFNIQLIRDENPDILLSIAGNQIFKKRLLSIPKITSLNLHTALLPKYRGLMPSFWVLKNGETETGVTVFEIDEGIDSGEIVVQYRYGIDTHTTQEELIRDTKHLGMIAIKDALQMYSTNPLLVMKTQNDASNMSYYKFPTSSDVSSFLSSGKKFY